MKKLEEHRELDRTDKAILRALQADGRISNVALAQKVHLSPTACLERVRNLSASGYIRSFRGLLDPSKLEAGMLVFVQVVLDRTTLDVLDSFRSAVLARPEILECHMIAGGFDYILKARVKDMRAYREFTAKALWALPGVRETHTYVVMEEVKETTELPVR
ncbi:MAG: winged helix-turn-helix transcriptional regulator [Burkholderiales bacterium]|nr:MAG: winged helix-turn-helix transcriptional regulator [Burkholderiales bacterium]